MHKNETFQTTITDMSINGEGIGKVSGMPFFIAGAVIGDKLTAAVTKLKKTYGYARIISIDEPSINRVVPACSIAGKCGGCSIMSMSYRAQLSWKEGFVANALERIAGISPEEVSRAKRPIAGMDEPWRFRNKSQYPVGRDKDGNITAGFYAPHSHRIVPIVTSGENGVGYRHLNRAEGTVQEPENNGYAGNIRIENIRDLEGGCMIAPAADRKILSAVLAYMKTEKVSPYDETTGRGLVRHVLIRHGFSTGQIMVCLIINGDKLPCEEALVKALSGVEGLCSVVINKNTRRDNVILGKKTRAVFGEPFIEDILLGNRFCISARSFFQVNPVQTEKLYQKAMEYACLDGSETVWDLYCGIGTISLSVAHSCREVIGIETVPDAIRDAKENARLNNISNVRFICGDAEDILNRVSDKSRLGKNPDVRGSRKKEAECNSQDTPARFPDPDVIIVDPPRKGLHPDVVDALIRRAPSRIVYVSCNPSTLSRDLKPLISAGYRLKEYTPYDQFCHSCHVETVVLMSRVKD